MTKEGELHAEEDRRRKEEIEIKNKADSMIYSVEKLLKENREKISEATPSPSKRPWKRQRRPFRTATARSTRPSKR